MGQGGHKDSVDVKCVHIYHCYYICNCNPWWYMTCHSASILRLFKTSMIWHKWILFPTECAFHMLFFKKYCILYLTLLYVDLHIHSWTLSSFPRKASNWKLFQTDRVKNYLMMFVKGQANLMHIMLTMHIFSLLPSVYTVCKSMCHLFLFLSPMKTLDGLKHWIVLLLTNCTQFSMQSCDIIQTMPIWNSSI